MWCQCTKDKNECVVLEKANPRDDILIQCVGLPLGISVKEAIWS